MLLKLFTGLIVAVTVFDCFNFLNSHELDLRLELLPDVFVYVVVVLIKGLERVKNLGFKSEGHSTRAVCESKEGVRKKLIVL